MKDERTEREATLAPLAQLTFLRFVAALVVVFFHYGLVLEPIAKASTWHGLLQGAHAVSFFFVLSGFVLTVVYGSSTELTLLRPQYFYRARIARIVPVYLLAGLCAYLVLHGSNLRDAVLFLLLLQAFVPRSALAVNPPAWSLSVEAAYYTVMPWLLLRARRLKFAALIGLAVVLWLASMACWAWLEHLRPPVSSRAHAFMNYFPFWHANQFVIGMVAGFAALRFRVSPGVAIVGMVLAAIALTGLQILRPSALYAVGGLAPFFALLILCVYWDRSALARLLSHRWLVFLGEASYAVYLMQVPIMELVQRQLIASGATSVGAFTTALLALLLVSSLVYHYFERPLRERVRPPR